MKVHYDDPMVDERSFVKADFERHGITDQGAVKFNASNDHTAELSDAAFEYLKGVGEPVSEVKEDQPELELDKDADQDATTADQVDASADGAPSGGEGAVSAAETASGGTGTTGTGSKAKARR